MAHFNRHTDRTGYSEIRLLDRDPAPAEIDEVALRTYRIERIRAEMAKRDIAALILSDAVNIRYATGTRNMQVFTTRNAPSRYLLLTECESILYEFAGCMHLADGFKTVTEVRPAIRQVLSPQDPPSPSGKSRGQKRSRRRSKKK